jgi:hypothetical protein
MPSSHDRAPNDVREFRLRGYGQSTFVPLLGSSIERERISKVHDVWNHSISGRRDSAAVLPLVGGGKRGKHSCNAGGGKETPGTSIIISQVIAARSGTAISHNILADRDCRITWSECRCKMSTNSSDIRGVEPIRSSRSS